MTQKDHDQPYNPLDDFRAEWEDYTGQQEETPPPVRETAAKVNKVTHEAIKNDLFGMKPLGKLIMPPANSEDEIIAKRFLCRRAGLLFPAPTGIGKSTFTIQTITQAALGETPYGLPFARKTKTLYVQAENDEGDMAEMRDGIYDASGYSTADLRLIDENVMVMSESTRTGLQLIEYVEGAVREFEPHILILDPLFAYLGGSASDQAVVSAFLRNMLNPMLQEQNIAAWLVHHTNKPPSGEQKSSWSAGEFAYLGSGSAEFANWSRAVLTIRQTAHPRIFELRSPKRGMRLGWTDGDGERTTVRYIAHAEKSIVWQDCDWHYAQEQIAEAKTPPGRPAIDVDPSRIPTHDGYPFVSASGADEAIKGLFSCKDSKALTIRKEYMHQVDGKWVMVN